MATDPTDPFLDSPTEFAVLAVSFRPDRLTLEVAPWSELWDVMELNYPAVEIQYIWSTKRHTAAEIQMPWEILDFDAYDLRDGRWKFILECKFIEICWHSELPLAPGKVSG